MQRRADQERESNSCRDLFVLQICFFSEETVFFYLSSRPESCAALRPDAGRLPRARAPRRFGGLSPTADSSRRPPRWWACRPSRGSILPPPGPAGGAASRFQLRRKRKMRQNSESGLFRRPGPRFPLTVLQSGLRHAGWFGPRLLWRHVGRRLDVVGGMGFRGI